MLNKASLISSLLLCLALNGSLLDSAFAIPALHMGPGPKSPEAGISVPIHRRSGLADSDGIFNVDKARVDVIMTVNKHRRNMMNYLSTQGSLPEGFEIKPLLALPVNLLQTLTGTNIKRQSVPLTDENNDELWDGQISIGSNAQEFIIDFDSPSLNFECFHLTYLRSLAGSSDLWVPSSNCTDSSCSSKKKYNSSASSSSEAQSGTFNIQYGDGSTVSGSIFADSVTVAKIPVTGQHFAAVTNMSIAQTSFDGILGMGYSTLSNLGAPTFFETAVKQGVVSSPEFSFFLSPNGSELYIGGTNSQLYTGDIEFHDVNTSPGYWKISDGSISVPSNASVVSGFDTIVDSGTTLIYGPTDAVKTLWASIPGASAYDAEPGFYMYPCNQTLGVSFSWGGKNWNIPDEHMSTGFTDGSGQNCVGAIVGQNIFGSSSPTWLVGDTFMKGVYSVFNLGNNQLGFAQLA
ncbi:acid protease [Lentinula boryana]|uniref:Acid protease n=1 Tax=Lentinula boryana TaxID=40481 RepID=A0ABQ8Q1E6_9AGAR|nr:acid protease [Lentinula boryana]